MQFFNNTKIDFLGKRKYFAIFSAIIIFASIAVIGGFGIDYGIDFTGGTELAIKFDKDINTDQIRQAVETAGYKGAEIKSFGETRQFLIRVRESGKTAEKLVEILKTSFPDNQLTLLKTDTIGPKIGKELRSMGVLAVILAVLAILLYIAFRFEFVFGLAAVIALIHDVIVTFGIINFVHHMGWINIEFNQNMIAAMLTVLGYSVNDTVIVFDRIRENKEKHKGLHFVKLANLSINETLSRTINTVLTVELVLITIVLFGGPVLQGFGFTLMIGIFAGAYSSIYIASAFVVWFLKKFKHVDVEDTEDKKTATAKA
jgi:preprotein translocase subunit SecF